MRHHLLFVCICIFKTAQSKQHIEKQSEINFLNFHLSAQGYIFSKLENLLSNQTTGSIEECWVMCVQNKECLSVNTIALDQKRYKCELLNWAGTGFEKHLVPKINSSFMQSETACIDNPCQNGGECTASERGTNYTCSCSPRYAGRNCDKISNCVLFDFESGRLDGWTLTGTAFNNQPTYRAARSNPQGDWCVSTYENRPSPSHPTHYQGDQPMGTATSPSFIIRGTKLRFMITGNRNCDRARLELLIGGTAVHKACGHEKWDMASKEFDVAAYRGKTANVRLVDNYDSSWGFIIVDHIEDSYCSE